MAVPKAKGVAAPIMIVDDEKTTSKTKNKTTKEKGVEKQLDFARATGPDPRDPRTEGAPCWGRHVPAPAGRGSRSGSNAWAQWKVCAKCSLRLGYIPRVGAPGHCRLAGGLAQDWRGEGDPRRPGDQAGGLGWSREVIDESVGHHPSPEEGFETRSEHGRISHSSRCVEEGRQARECQAGRAVREGGGRGHEESSGSFLGYGGDVSTVDSPAMRSLTDEERVFLLDSLRSSESDLVEAFAQIPGEGCDLVEICCGPNSMLSQVVEELGGRAERIGLFNGYDMSTPKGLEKARKRIRELRPRWLWFSLPCGPTSPIQNLNELTPEMLEKSLKRKRKSRKTVKNCALLATEHVEVGGHFGWEWPRGNQAWHFPEIIRLVNFLEQRGCQHTAKLDGCMTGVIAPDNGMPMKKPWKILTTSKDMSMRLSIRCDGKHEHVECLGHKRAAHSAFYPRKMCIWITKVVLSSTRLRREVFGLEGRNTDPSKYPKIGRRLPRVRRSHRRRKV